MKELKTVLFIIILISGCTNNKGESESIQKVDFNNIVTNYYNSNNKLIHQKTVSTKIRNGISVEIKSHTKFFYTDKGKLKKEVRILQNNDSDMESDTALTFYDYDENNKLIRKVYIDYSGDTLEIEKNKYFEKDNIKIIERTSIKKNFYKLNDNEVDTTHLLIEEVFDDSLKKEVRYYKKDGKAKVLNETEFFNYNLNHKLKSSYTLDIKNDTVQTINYSYAYGTLRSKVHFIKEIGFLSKEIYDVNGCIEKVVSINKLENITDTVYYECDEQCNVVKMKW